MAIASESRIRPKISASPQIFDVPGKGLVEFPAGMSDAEIVAAIKRNTLPDSLKLTTDPKLLALLNAPVETDEWGGIKIVTDPDLLARLNAPEPVKNEWGDVLVDEPKNAFDEVFGEEATHTQATTVPTAVRKRTIFDRLAEERNGDNSSTPRKAKPDIFDWARQQSVYHFEKVQTKGLTIDDDTLPIIKDGIRKRIIADYNKPVPDWMKNSKALSNDGFFKKSLKGVTDPAERTRLVIIRGDMIGDLANHPGTWHEIFLGIGLFLIPAVLVALLIVFFVRRKKKTSRVPSPPPAAKEVTVDMARQGDQSDTPQGWRASFGTRKQQTIAIWVVMALLLASWIYPPWIHYNPRANGYGAEHPHGWFFLFDTVQGEGGSQLVMQVDLVRLILMNAIIIAGGGVLAWSAARLRLRWGASKLRFRPSAKLLLVFSAIGVMLLAAGWWLLFLQWREVKQKKADAKAEYDRTRQIGWAADIGSEVGKAIDEARRAASVEEVRRFRMAAEKGDAVAQCNLGYRYDTGKGVPEDHTEAAKWYRKAAEQGQVTAQFNLGLCYANGEGVPKDFTVAVKWYRKAAEQGEPTAQRNLGYCYTNGEGVPKDDAEAARWYRRSAEQGNANAQNDLGNCYRKGVGVPKDLMLAYMWYNLAGTVGAKYAEQHRDQVAGEITTEQIATAQALSRYWKPKKETTGH